MQRRRADCRRGALALALALASAACGSDRGIELARDARYRVTFEVEAPATLGETGTLRMHVAPRGGWKVAPEAPVQLDLDAPESLVFDPASPSLPEGAASEDGFDLVTALRAYRSGAILANGRLRFGICAGPESVCVAVDREFRIPIEVTFDS